MSEGIDIEEFSSALEATVQYFNSRKGNTQVAEELLLGMAEKSLELIKANCHVKDIRFTYQEICDFHWSNVDDSEQASRKVRAHKEKMHALLQKDSPLSEFLREGGCSKPLCLESDDIKGGSKTSLWLSLRQSEVSDREIISKDVTYKAVHLAKPRWWLKAFLKIELAGRKRWLFVFVFFVPLLAILGLILTVGFLKSSVFIVIYALLFAFFGRVFLLLYEIMQKGVVRAPEMMIPLSVQNALFVQRRKGKKGTDEGSYKVIELVVWEADCGICGEPLFIEKGGREFFGRYVGKCGVAPTEHVFTFDHVTKKGTYARKV